MVELYIGAVPQLLVGSGAERNKGSHAGFSTAVYALANVATGFETSAIGMFCEIVEPEYHSTIDAPKFRRH